MSETGCTPLAFFLSVSRPSVILSGRGCHWSLSKSSGSGYSVSQFSKPGFC